MQQNCCSSGYISSNDAFGARLLGTKRLPQLRRPYLFVILGIDEKWIFFCTLRSPTTWRQTATTASPSLPFRHPCMRDVGPQTLKLFAVSLQGFPNTDVVQSRISGICQANSQLICTATSETSQHQAQHLPCQLRNQRPTLIPREPESHGESHFPRIRLDATTTINATKR